MALNIRQPFLDNPEQRNLQRLRQAFEFRLDEKLCFNPAAFAEASDILLQRRN
jgi:hypothetical protein